jgi:hypothetical protein
MSMRAKRHDLTKSTPGPSRLTRLPLLGAALALASCSSAPEDGDEGRDAAAVTLPVLAGCEGEFYGVCNVLDPACQNRVFSTVQCLRAMPDARLPELRVISTEQYAAELRDYPADEPDAISQQRVFERAVQLLGLAMPAELSDDSYVELYTETVPAYYSDQTGMITLIDDGSNQPDDPGRATLTLAHELVHALQDQDTSLTSLYDATTTFDDTLALTSMIEGEAAMLESFVAAQLWGFAQNPDFRTHYTSWVANAERDFDGQSPLLVSQRYFPYSYGARFVFDLFSAGGIQNVRTRLAAPPTSVLPMLLSVDTLVEPELESLAALGAPEPLPGFELMWTDSLGPWVFGKFLERVVYDFGANDLRSHWRGDRFFVYSLGEQTVTALWTLRFDDASAAEQLLQLLESGPMLFQLAPKAFYSRSGRDLTIGVLEDPSTKPDWTAALDSAEREWSAGTAAGADMSAARRLPTRAAARLWRALSRQPPSLTGRSWR